MPTITLKQGDCLELMKELPDDLVLITDPPYGINLDLRWLSEFNKNTLCHLPNKADERLMNDEKPINLTPLLRFKRRLIFGFPYLYDKYATGWIVWDKMQGDERLLTTPVEIASTTLRHGFDIMRVKWHGFIRDTQINEYRFAHPTQKPLKLMYRIIEKYTKESDTILDPFMGSGTTGVACVQLNRNFIGYEISPDYFKIAEKRIGEAQAQKKLGDL